MSKDHLGLLCDVGELSALLSGSANIESFLREIVALVAKHLEANVCSIYLYDEDAEELVLRANVGLKPDSVGNVRLKVGEGLTGLALQQLRPIIENKASQNPHYKYFPDIDEEAFESFLAVPIQKGIERIGAVVVQRAEDHPFDDNDVMALRATASQLAGAIENAKLLMQVGEEHEDVNVPELLARLSMVKGEVGSEGFAVGTGVVVDKERDHRRLIAPHFDKDYTQYDFQQALARTGEQFHGLQSRLEDKLSEDASLIFSAQSMMLMDGKFTGEMASRIERGANPPQAVLDVAKQYIDMFGASPHAYIREKAHDVEDLAQRILRNIVGAGEDPISARENHIVLARDLFPSDILKLSCEGVAGIVLVSGGVTSHVSILARSLQVPLVIADEPELLAIPEETRVLLDAEMGHVYVDPSPDVLDKFAERERSRQEASRLASSMKPTTITRDGTRVRLMANINLLSELRLANDLKAEGVGLYRTEFPFLVRSSFPSEEEQLVVYEALMEEMAGKDVTVRTLDIGGDKVLAYYDNIHEENPVLGLRSIRFSLRHREIFQQQLRAILRAGAGHSKLRIMFPMISSVDEFLSVKAAVHDCIAMLEEEGLERNLAPAVGVMVEIPSAVEVIDDLAEAADFLCIGTNDLIQFMLAVDRTNEKVAAYYLPHHPAVLRALKRIADAGARHGKEVSICGEMAQEVRYVPFLVGIGIRTLSLDPRHLPRVQKAVQELSVDEAERHAEALLSQGSIEAVDELLRSS